METQTPGSSGLLGSLRGFADGLIGSVHDRVELLSIELHEEKHRLIQILIWISVIVFTGFLALTLYYYGLQRTPAMLSSLAELTYPAVAVIAGIYAYDQHLTWSQWLGVGIILTAVTLLPMQRRRTIVEIAVPEPEIVPA